MRVVVVLWWMLAGLCTAVLYAILYNMPGMRDVADLAQVAGLFVSPLSTMAVGWDNNSLVHGVAPVLRILLGVIGLLGMGFYLSTLTHRRRVPAPPPPREPAPAAAPDGLSAGPLD